MPDLRPQTQAFLGLWLGSVLKRFRKGFAAGFYKGLGVEGNNYDIPVLCSCNLGLVRVDVPVGFF